MLNDLKVLRSEFDYELLDCGEFRRLERFGKLIIDRPCPQAPWKKKKCINWDKSDVIFRRPKTGAGSWQFTKELPNHWNITVGKAKVELKFSAQNQVGIFPEQWENWKWVAELIYKSRKPLKILNLFAYTGVATVMASHVGAEEVCHVDGAKSSVNWARKNAALTGLPKKGIRWIEDDVLKFLEREVKRGKKYDGVLLDPPAFGRGKGKRDWQIERDLPTCIDLINQLLTEKSRFVILTCHAPNLTSEMMGDYLTKLSVFKGHRPELLELKIPSKNGNDLPSSFGARIFR